MRLSALLLLLPALCLAQAPTGYTIKSIVGNGAAGFAGDASQAASAQISAPAHLFVDSSGVLYIADTANYRIRKVDTGGTISTVAGNGTSGYLGDDGPATSAEVNLAGGVTVDKSGNLFISDSGNYRVRKVTSAGTISLFAGNGSPGFTGDTLAARDAEIYNARGIVVDSGGVVYFVDQTNQRIRKVTTDGNINTIAGTGTIGWTGDGGPALSATFNYPDGLAIDSAGNLYVADTKNGVIRKITTDGTITTVAGNGTLGYSGDGGQARQAALYYPKGVAVDSAGNLFIVDSFTHRVRMVTPNGIISTIAGTGTPGDSGDQGPATSAQLSFPTGIAIDSSGKIYVADAGNSRIKLLTSTGQPAPAGVPVISRDGVAGAAAFGALATVAPGSWIEIYGLGLASTTRGWAASDFTGSTAPTSLDGTRVSVGGQPAFISYVSPTQVNAQLPSNLGTGPQQVTVITPSGTSAVSPIFVNSTQPGLFAPPAWKLGDNQFAAATFSDGKTYVLATGAIAGVNSRPAHPGETITLYGSGFGPVTPNIDAGQVANQPTALNIPVKVYIGGASATVSYAGLAPGAVGLYQFNVVVPDVPGADGVPLTFNQGGVDSAQILFITVQN